MTTRPWRCCTPLIAYGCGGRFCVYLHGPECDQPLLRRRTLTRRRDSV
jgi:hypothetical protein